MKKILLVGAILLFSLFSQLSTAYAAYVNGYYRSNGTYVNGYERTAPDGNPYNNYSYPGNYNPNTGSITGGNPSTYLDDYYNNSSYGSVYTPTYTPTICPLNSYSSGTSCKCNSGYSVSGGSCVSNDSMCRDQLGFSSSYDSLSGNCKCSYGYVIGSSGKCESASLWCSNQIGLMSQYNSSSKKCECMSGYEFDGASCVYKKTSSYYPSTYSNNSISSCPLNAHVSSSDSTTCLCDSGYMNNLSNDGCVLKPIKTNTQLCQDDFGTNVDWDGTKTIDGQLNCNCKSGYIWNSERTACSIAPIVKTEPAPISNIAPTVKVQPEKKVDIKEIKKVISDKNNNSPAYVLKARSSTTTTTVLKNEDKKGWWSKFISWFK